MNIAIVSPDEKWRRYMNEALKTRGFGSIRSGVRLDDCDFNADAILLDASDYNEEIDSQVQRYVDTHPLCEWILFFSGQARLGDISLLTRTACFDILSKAASMDRVSIYILAACMRKRNAEERLKALKMAGKGARGDSKKENDGQGGCDA